jgi:hypothetical protein
LSKRKGVSAVAETKVGGGKIMIAKIIILITVG